MDWTIPIKFKSLGTVTKVVSFSQLALKKTYRFPENEPLRVYTPSIAPKNPSFACPPLGEPLHTQPNASGIAEIK